MPAWGARRSAGRRNPQQESPSDGHHEIGHRTRSRYPEHVALGITQIRKLDRNRLRPTENEQRRFGQHRHRNQKPRDRDGTDRVDMLERIQGHPAQHVCGLIAKPSGDIAVCRFVQGYREDHRHRPKNDGREGQIHWGTILPVADRRCLFVAI
jgi:hypothetical protein